ncbi:indoleamine 2,3-dioxygenase family protein [Xylariomycetidae sp. FL2044]|nr:indoleamine 2,3-dioxygenase family protein [Xylariomycetidae sp. FL2044]
MLVPKSQFEVLEDAKPHDSTLPAFMVSTTRGFLPRMHPVVDLPPEFEAVDTLLQAMPVRTLAGVPGLLAEGLLGDAVLQSLPDLTECVDVYRHDLPMMNALYRDYSFLASAYLLEPCHMRFMKGEPYGLGRSFLPAQLSRPIARCAELCGFKPFMEYAGSYALFNYRLEDPSQGLEYSNLRLIRAFEHGLDPASSEAGFVLVHVEMVKNSGPLVDGIMTCLSALDGASQTPPLSSLQQRKTFNAGLGAVLDAMCRVNGVMESMWAKSKPRSYTSFRTFIFGITSQSMFPDGVVYEGINEGKPLSFRGESGANDSMIPLLDNFCQIQMPATPLTEILKDFRDYRPSNHRQFLGEVKMCAEELALKDYALAVKPARGEGVDAESVRESRCLWIQVLNQIRDFRWRHWCFAREYILKQTSHPTATGGSPIVTWLPNQLQAVMEEMTEVYESVGGPSQVNGACRDIMDLVDRQRQTLLKEVDKYCKERGVSAAP